MRSGFSLIELVLSILISAIALMAIPTIVGQTSNNNAYGLIQQSVMDARTRMALILQAPYECVEPALSIHDKVPVFGDTAGLKPTDNFYTRNEISMHNRRVFGEKATNAIMPLDPDNNGICRRTNQKNLRSFKEQITVENSISDTSELKGARDNIVKSTMEVKPPYFKNMDGTEDTTKNITNITIETKASMGGRGEPIKIVLRSYVANIGDGPDILSRSW